MPEQEAPEGFWEAHDERAKIAAKERATEKEEYKHDDEEVSHITGAEEEE